ncbi:protein transporter tim10 [Teratosphaeriaceae sp. CCFEE 6253]|nr:protein transporter tim10 [Teratosphaeriaceae sp. CCFEE 6253]
MSFLFGGGARPQPTSAEKIAAAEAEIEMCIPAQYREADLNKGESVCLDRCVAKFFEVNVKVSEKMQGEAAQRQGGAAPSGGMFG